jgi:hypothetical protein
MYDFYGHVYSKLPTRCVLAAHTTRISTPKAQLVECDPKLRGPLLSTKYIPLGAHGDPPFPTSLRYSLKYRARGRFSFIIRPSQQRYRASRVYEARLASFFLFRILSPSLLCSFSLQTIVVASCSTVSTTRQWMVFDAGEDAQC